MVRVFLAIGAMGREWVGMKSGVYFAGYFLFVVFKRTTWLRSRGPFQLEGGDELYWAARVLPRSK